MTAGTDGSARGRNGAANESRRLAAGLRAPGLRLERRTRSDRGSGSAGSIPKMAIRSRSIWRRSDRRPVRRSPSCRQRSKGSLRRRRSHNVRKVWSDDSGALAFESQNVQPWQTGECLGLGISRVIRRPIVRTIATRPVPTGRCISASDVTHPPPMGWRSVSSIRMPRSEYRSEPACLPQCPRALPHARPARAHRITRVIRAATRPKSRPA